MTTTNVKQTSCTIEHASFLNLQKHYIICCIKSVHKHCICTYNCMMYDMCVYMWLLWLWLTGWSARLIPLMIAGSILTRCSFVFTRKNHVHHTPQAHGTIKQHLALARCCSAVLLQPTEDHVAIRVPTPKWRHRQRSQEYRTLSSFRNFSIIGIDGVWS